MSIEYKKDKEKEYLEEVENREWLESLDYILHDAGSERVKRLLRKLQIRAQESGVDIPFTANTPYINTIPLEKQVNFPGSMEIERRIRSIIRWNAMAMVVRANKEEDGIGGHISTYASAATLYDIGFNHFFRARNKEQEGDIIYFQGHASPGIYARAFLEGRLTIEHMENFRNEIKSSKGLSSYPHPWLMPDFWEFPTVSMGLSPIMAIYQARFNRYLEDRGLKKETDSKVWAFIGDGETDEPETLGAITLASREKLDNLIFVVNCNLQRLDGPVRGNGKIIQELEAIFRGAGWNVIKIIWGNDWDPLLAADKEGVLIDRMESAVDGDYQKYIVEPGSYIREHFFGTDPRLKELVKNYSDEQLEKLRRGGHDSVKVYNAYKAAVENDGSPTVILAKTIKGYGLGEAGEGRNITHQQKKLNEEELKEFRTRFGIPISDEDVAKAPFYKPDENSQEIKYLKESRKRLGGYIPRRKVECKKLSFPSDDIFSEFKKGSGDREVATTMAFVRMLSKLLKDKDIGDLIVPIVPDEARTFGMEALFRQVGIYSHVGQIYEPVDKETLLYYKEAIDGQILEEGITEAGSMSSFIAAGSAYATHGINTIPFFIYYSMFGLQRIGDLVWAAGDMRCKGFLVGGTAGRTTLAGEGLQHQDGHSHLLAYSVPNLIAYDPAYAYEIAVIIQDGIDKMYNKQQDVFYYFTVMNETYIQPPMPEGVEEGIINGIYKLAETENTKGKYKVALLGSGTILNECIKAKKILEEQYDLKVEVYSVTSYKEIYKNCQDTERWNMLHPSEINKIPYVNKCLSDDLDSIIAVSDYVKALPESISSWLPIKPISLGTDGFGRSASRADLRSYFEVDYRYIVIASLYGLVRDKKIKSSVLQKTLKEYDINKSKLNPMFT
jgi:pyruvate dehydrogenase E1 component